MGKTKMDILAKVQKKMSRYKENCIFIFDEFATAFSDPNNQAVAANLLSFLDTSSQSFPYCIALTTDKEYYSSLATRTPIVRRTRPIPLDIMGKEATQLVLRHMFTEEAPEIEIDKSIYAEIYERTTIGPLSNQPQPSISQEILKDAINKAMTRKDLSDEIKKKSLQSQLLQKENKDRVDPRTYTQEGNELYVDYDQVEKELSELENKQRQQQIKYDKYFHWKRKQLKHRDKMVSKAIKIANIKEKNIQDMELKEFILEHHYFTEALLSKVEVEKTKFLTSFPEAKTCIDLELIIQVIEERIHHIEEENKKATQHIQEKKLENQTGMDLASSALSLNSGF